MTSPEMFWAAGAAGHQFALGVANGQLAQPSTCPSFPQIRLRGKCTNMRSVRGLIPIPFRPAWRIKATTKGSRPETQPGARAGGCSKLKRDENSKDTVSIYFSRVACCHFHYRDSGCFVTCVIHHQPEAGKRCPKKIRPPAVLDCP